MKSIEAFKLKLNKLKPLKLLLDEKSVEAVREAIKNYQSLDIVQTSYDLPPPTGRYGRKKVWTLRLGLDPHPPLP